MSIEQKISKLDALLQIARAELEEIRNLTSKPKIYQKGMVSPEISNPNKTGVPKKK
jgi:hypothetical protein